jgi:hypothetical protein
MTEKKEKYDELIKGLETFQLETEFFGFTPLSFVDDVVNIVYEYIYAAADSLRSYMENIDLGIPLSEIHRVSKFVNALLN